MSFKTADASGTIRSCGIRFPANGVRRYCGFVSETALLLSNDGFAVMVRGSYIVYGLFAVVIVCEKSPARCSAVGTDPCAGCGCMSRYFSAENMKKLRSF